MTSNPFEEINSQLSRLEMQYNRIESLLLDKNGKNQQPLPATSDNPMTIKQAAEFLQMTVGSLYGKVHKRTVPFSKRGKTLYFSRAELLNWLNDGRHQTIDQIENDARHGRSSPKSTKV